MPSNVSTYNKELSIIFGGICDELRQEVRYRYLTQLIAPQKVLSLTEEREAQLVASLAYHIRTIGFPVQVESYFYDQARSQRPDLAILLPASKKYIFLELKIIDPYAGFIPAIKDIIKRENITSPRDKRNGLIALGFRNPTGPRERFNNKYESLSKKITSEHPYRKIGIKKIDLEGMDDKAVYAMIGFWIRIQN